MLHPKTGELHAYLNGGENPSNPGVYIWNPIGSIASGLGPGADVRFADIDGDGVSRQENNICTHTHTHTHL